MANEKNFLGLDIGSNSVGWAVTDENYRIKKFKGNLMWGDICLMKHSSRLTEEYFVLLAADLTDVSRG